MKDERWPRGRKKKQPHRQNQPHNLSLRLNNQSHPNLCFCPPQETDTEYGNLQLKHQPASRKASKWVGGCVWAPVWTGCPEIIHVSSKPHTAALLSFPKHVLVSVFSLVSAVSFHRKEERWVEGGGKREDVTAAGLQLHFINSVFQS